MKNLKIAFAKWRLRSLEGELQKLRELHAAVSDGPYKDFIFNEIKNVNPKIRFWIEFMNSITQWDDLRKEQKQIEDQYIKALERRVELLEQIMDARGIKYKLGEVSSSLEQLKLHITAIAITAIAKLQNKDEIDVVGALIEVEIIVDEQADELIEYFGE